MRIEKGHKEEANVVDKKRACEYQQRACLYHFPYRESTQAHAMNLHKHMPILLGTTAYLGRRATKRGAVVTACQQAKNCTAYAARDITSRFIKPLKRQTFATPVSWRVGAKTAPNALHTLQKHSPRYQIPKGIYPHYCAYERKAYFSALYPTQLYDSAETLLGARQGRLCIAGKILLD